MARQGITLLASTLLAAALVLVVAQASPADALIEQCRVHQVIRHTGGTQDLGGGVLSRDGERLYFASRYDLVPGRNADRNNEVFEQTLRTGAVRQLTSTSGIHGSQLFSISADGRRVLLSSDRRQPNNPQGRYELFLLDLPTGSWHQITHQSRSLGATQADANLDRVAFVASYDPNGDNPDGERELFLWDRATDDLQTVTFGDEPLGDGVVGSAATTLSGDGQTVAYGSRRDELGDGSSADGNGEVFLYDVATATRTQLTDTVDPSPGGSELEAVDAAHGLDLDDDGDTLAIAGTADLDGGEAAATFITVADLSGPSAAFQQVHRVAFFSFSQWVSLDDAGNRLLYQIALDGGQERGLVDLDGDETAEPAPGLGSVGVNSIGLGEDGTRVTFLSTANPVGENPDGNRELFWADCRTFRDVSPRHPFAAEIEWAVAEGISTGYPDATFRPDQAVSRQALAAFLHRLAGAPPVVPPNPPTFSDVGTSHPFRAEIEWAYAEEIVRGYPNGTFRSAVPINRQAAAAFLRRAAPDDGFAPPTTATFSDVSPNHPFFAEVEWLADAGITTGYLDGTFRPDALVNRQSAAAFLHRLANGPGIEV
jgi:hypothetical protein